MTLLKPPTKTRARGAGSKRTLSERLFLLLALALLMVLVGIPILLILLAAVSNTLPRPGNISIGNLDLGPMITVLGSPQTVRAALTSVGVATGAAAVAYALGAGFALLIARTNAPFKRAMYIFAVSPMFLPAFVASLAWAVLASPSSGLLNTLLQDFGLPPLFDAFSIPGLILVLGVYYSPYVFMFMHSSLALMNPELEEAALVHGSPMRTAIAKVTLPLTTPATIGSVLLVFTLSVENFPVAQFLGTPAGIDTLPTLIYRLMSASPAKANEAAAIAVVLVAIVGFIVLLQNRYVSKRSYATVGGKGVRNKLIDIGRWKGLASAATIVYFLVVFILPVAALTVVATYSSPYISSIIGMTGSFSFGNLTDTMLDPSSLQSFGNSIVVSISAALLGTIICFYLAYLVYRTKIPGRSSVEHLAMAPLAVPAIVLGMGLLWTWLIAPLPLYGTLGVLVVAFVAANLPQGFRGISSSILQFNADLEDTAVMHGSPRSGAILRITAPLLRTGILSTFILLMMLSLRELTVPLFLYTSNTEILSISIFNAYENGQVATAATLALINTFLITALVVVSNLLEQRKENA